MRKITGRRLPSMLGTVEMQMPKSMTTSEEAAKMFYEQNGFVVIRPSWPDLLIFKPEEKKMTFVEVKRVGDRLSAYQSDTMKLLKAFGVAIEVAIVTEKNDVIPIPFDETDIRLRIPRKIFYQKVQKKIEELVPKIEIFDPAKHSEEIKKSSKEYDEEAKKKFEEDTDWMTPLLRKKDTSPPLTSTLESLPEEAPDLERKVREVVEDGQEMTNKG